MVEELDRSVSRRDFFQVAGVGTTLLATGAWLHAANDSISVFPQSVASGDPSTTGVVLWTRIDPTAYRSDEALRYQVAVDDRFQNIVVEGTLDAALFGPDRDHTVHLDLNGQLQSGRRYAYRFIYRNVVSRTGRCRTMPKETAFIWRLRLGVITCQDYTNGYYGALARLAAESVDFVVHLGDAIYETVRDPRFQSNPYPDRVLTLPSGQKAVTGLEDYRYLYRQYASDPLAQLLREQHTFITIWDDHETANDSYWDYERDTLGAPDHPLTTGQPGGGDPAALRALKRDSQQAWTEYTPARVVLNSAATHPHEYLSIYRQFRFGRLMELFATDERTYRNGPPCGGRYLIAGCPEQADPDRSMLGPTQRDWLIQGLTSSTAQWKVWANEVFLGQLKIGRQPGPELFINVDAWDGYEAERQQILQAFRTAGKSNLVALTGDLHASIAAYLKLDYRQRDNAPANLAGVEFMTPAISSSTLVQQLLKRLTREQMAELGLGSQESSQRFLFENLAKATNPHIHYLNAQDWGYSILDWTPWDCTYSMYSVSTSVNSFWAPRTLVRKIRVPANTVKFQDLV